jgi:hypothetical protein
MMSKTAKIEVFELISEGQLMVQIRQIKAENEFLFTSTFLVLSGNFGLQI